MLEGIVVNSQKNYYQVKTFDGLVSCSIRNKLFYGLQTSKSLVVTGDKVLFEKNQDDHGVIVQVQPRKTKFSRFGTGGKDSHHEQIIAANIDQVIIVCSVKNPSYKLNLIDRYILAAKSEGIEPIVCFNKIDLNNSEEVYQDVENYHKQGIKAITVSVFSNTGIDDLKELLKDKISVLSGPSGVGKSSIINNILDSEITKVTHVSEKVDKGRHTTTSSSLYELSFGGMILDTPGMKEFAIFNVEKGFDETFSDIIALSENCKFRNCSHIHEPSCAVKDAIENGELKEQRLKSYLKIKRK
ncbi:MAG: ribosome small subunit-dependent GTPase A [Candidatus Sericytochromatia bacterium]